MAESNLSIQDRKDRALAYLREKRLEDARAIYAEVCKRSDADADSWFMLGAVSGQLGQVDQVVRCCRKAIELRHDHVDAHYNLAQAYMHQKRYAEAIASYHEVVRLVPRHPTALNNLGYALQQVGQYPEAALCHQNALQIQPRDAEAWNNLGNALKGAGKLEQAVLSYRRSTEINPYYAEAYKNLGATLTLLARHDEAEESLRKAIELKPDIANMHAGLGMTLQGQGKYQEAIECYRKALQLDPNLSQARYLLAAVGGASAPPQSPSDYIKKLFDDYADRFDRHLVDSLEYRAPQHVNDAVRKFIDQDQKLDILDLGCGTGLCGPLLRDLARTLVGIDLSPNMLEKARQKGMYDALLEGDISHPPLDPAAKFDLVVSIDVFVYVGDLKPVFIVCQSCIRSGGYFAFSVEAANDDTSYVLQVTNRYAQSAKYIKELTHEFGFALLSSDEIVLRRDKDRAAVRGYVFVLRKN